MVNLSKPRCLLIDDDIAIRMLARVHLDQVGGEVVEAPDATQARRLLHDGGPFALVVADHRLPSGESGMDLLAIAAQQEPRPALFIMSAHLDPDTELQAVAAGVGIVDKLDLGPLVSAWTDILRQSSH